MPELNDLATADRRQQLPSVVASFFMRGTIAGMYFFTFHGLPNPLNPESATIGGAFINCWVDRSTLSEAEAAARQSLEQAGWQIKSLDDTRIVDRSDYEDNQAGLEYFEQAVIDKEVFVLYQYPVGEES
jgi:hypothetical protein